MTRIPKPDTGKRASLHAMEMVYTAVFNWLYEHGYIQGPVGIRWELRGPKKMAIYRVDMHGRREIADVFIGRRYLHIMPLISPKR